MRHRFKRSKFGDHVFLQGNKCSLIAHLIAIVRCGEDRDTFPVVTNFVSLVLNLVAPNDVLQLISVQEGAGDVGSELYAYAALARGTSREALGIRPEEVTHDTRIRGLSVSVEGLDVFEENAILLEETSVSNEDTVVDDVAQWQPVEDFREEIGHVLAVLFFNFSIKPVHLVHVYRLVVTTRHVHVIRIQQFEAEQGEYNLHRE